MAVVVGGPSRPVPPPPHFLGENAKKKEDYNFIVENTDLITQRNNSPFDFTKYVVRANF